MRNFKAEKFSGWGRYPVEACHLFRPDKQAEAAALLRSAHPEDVETSYISRGLGRSYGDAALNRDAGVISHLRLNRFLSFDEKEGILECEAGVTLAEIIEHFLPRGFFPPVTPGTKFATLGGAVACDVHGKNHHRDGTLGQHVVDLKLLTASGEILTCSPESNADVFWATVGGMGLTGAIVSARILMRRVSTAYFSVDTEKTRSLDETLERFEDSDKDYQFSVAWIDCGARKARLGRSVLIRGNHATPEQTQIADARQLVPPKRRGANVPFSLPSRTLNSFTIGILNSLYYGLHRNRKNQIADYDSFLYPLDRIGNWNRVYGRKGFIQFQLVAPLEKSRKVLVDVLEGIAKTGRSSSLAVLKRFGPQNSGLLSFPLEGYTLALDFPVRAGLAEFTADLSRYVAHNGGRVYLAKDAVVPPDFVAEMYPKLEQFREIKKRLDPKDILSSSLSRRLEI